MRLAKVRSLVHFPCRRHPFRIHWSVNNRPRAWKPIFNLEPIVWQWRFCSFPVRSCCWTVRTVRSGLPIMPTTLAMPRWSRWKRSPSYSCWRISVLISFSTASVAKSFEANWSFFFAVVGENSTIETKSNVWPIAGLVPNRTFKCTPRRVNTPFAILTINHRRNDAYLSFLLFLWHSLVSIWFESRINNRHFSSLILLDSSWNREWGTNSSALQTNHGEGPRYAFKEIKWFLARWNATLQRPIGLDRLRSLNSYFASTRDLSLSLACDQR